MSLPYNVYSRPRGEKKVMVAKFRELRDATIWARDASNNQLKGPRVTVEAGRVLSAWTHGVRR